MKKNKNISDSEWAIMNVLWEESNLTLRQIYEKVIDEKWSYTTVRTLVTRLAEKEIIGADKNNPGNFKYYPLISESDCKGNAVTNFIDKVFDGSKSLLIASLTKDSNLTEKEQKELAALIEKMED